MTENDPNARRATRRGFLAGTAGLAALAGAISRRARPQADGAPASEIEPFFGPHQGGIITPAQRTPISPRSTSRRPSGPRSWRC